MQGVPSGRAMVAHTRAVQRGHGHRAVRRFRRCRVRGRLRRHLAARAVPPAGHAARRPHRSRHALAAGGPRPRRHRRRGGRRLARTGARGPALVPASRLPGGDLPRRGGRARCPHGGRRALRRAWRRSTWPPSASPRCATPPPIGVCRWRSSSRPSPPSPTSRRHGTSSASRTVRTPASWSTSGTTAGAATTTTRCGRSTAAGSTRCSSLTLSAIPSGRRSRT